MDLSKLTDQLYALRQDRLAAQKEVDALEKQEKELRAKLFDALKASPTGAVSGSIAHAEVRSSIVPTLVDADAFLAWARKSPKRAGLLKVGVVTDAWRTFVSNGGEVEGVEEFVKEDLSLTKVK
ncbi:MAG: hypothetical protein VW362_08970 [Candidatus Nanopelagicales bacterium]